MDPRIKLLIEQVRVLHAPTWWHLKDVATLEDPWCAGCMSTCIHKECPVLKVADELEKEDGEESSRD